VILEDPHRKLSYVSSGEEKNAVEQEGQGYAAAKYF
jgi:hypothetical protein